MRTKTLLVASTLSIAFFVLLGIANRGPRESSLQTEGAFRDGLFLAHFDTEHGRGAHIASGRWSSPSDRALFVAGYRQGYDEFMKAHSGKQAPLKQAKLTKSVN